MAKGLKDTAILDLLLNIDLDDDQETDLELEETDPTETIYNISI